MITEYEDSNTELSTEEQFRKKLEVVIDRERFRELSESAANALHDQIMKRGEAAREVADVLHGKQLGHALHPVLTAVTIGSLTAGIIYDLFGFLPGFGGAAKSANSLTTFGTLSVLPTALTGLTDFSTIKHKSSHYGLAHGIVNTLAFLFYMKSVAARLSGKRATGFLYSAVGLSLFTVSSWIGGDMVYRQGVATNHATENGPEEWTPVLGLVDLEEEKPTAAELDDTRILLFRQGDDVYAIGATCAHAGGPLEEGKVVDGVCIQCPWHQSVFDMRTGKVVHSPSTFNQPRYDVRIVDGQIEVRQPAYIPSEDDED